MHSYIGGCLVALYQHCNCQILTGLYCTWTLDGGLGCGFLLETLLAIKYNTHQYNVGIFCNIIPQTCSSLIGKVTNNNNGVTHFQVEGARTPHRSWCSRSKDGPWGQSNSCTCVPIPVIECCMVTSSSYVFSSGTFFQFGGNTRVSVCKYMRKIKCAHCTTEVYIYIYNSSKSLTIYNLK